jgi:formiminotetrahydrofolate cyclodeaminase
MDGVYIDMPLRYFLDKLASKSPEPGGGSVAALTGALGAGLVSMVANLTIDKEKYQDVQPLINTLLMESESLRDQMQELVQKDTEAYSVLSKVYKMSRNTDAEKAIRAVALQDALKKACQVPFEIAEKSLEIAKLAHRVADIGNVTAISDAGIASLLAHACAQSAALNVKINLKSIRDKEYNERIWAEIQGILEQAADLERTVLTLTYKKIG